MQKVTEKQLDKAIAAAFSNPDFATWFLSHTRFASNNSTNMWSSKWSRSNYPWSIISLTMIDPETGESSTLSKGSETDILVLFEDTHKKRIAIHIENKLRGGAFTPLQPEFYHARAAQWKDEPKYGSYTDYEVVLIAPQEFYDKNKNECEKFHRFISHEAIGAHIPEFQV